MARIDQLREMLANEPQDLFLRYAYGLELVKEGRTNDGLHVLHALNRDFPDHVPAYFRRAQILFERGDAEEAKAVCREGIEVARRVGDQHALGEMTGFLELMSDA